GAVIGAIPQDLKYKGEYTGVKADAFAWSLNYFKVITCGEGGVFFTNDNEAFLKGVYQSDPGTPMWDSDLETDVEEVPPISRGGYRGNEINAAVARKQLEKLDEILNYTRNLKNTLLNNLNSPQHYKLQHVDDPEGECGISFTMIADSEELAKKFSDRLLEEGLEIGSIYNEGFPDRHIYTYWDSVINKNGATDLNYPWNDPSYKGNVEYRKDLCPQTLDILGRSLRLNIHLNMTETNMKEIAAAINKVDNSI
ncbi:MAG: DegT/DnrJ/EryC1/StrS family aminotransferase, partial [bacterium]